MFNPKGKLIVEYTSHFLEQPKEQEENKVNGSTNEQIEKQDKEKVKENKVYSKLIEEIHWHLGYRPTNDRPTDQKVVEEFKKRSKAEFGVIRLSLRSSFG